MHDDSRKLDLLLINPGGRQRIYQDLSTDLAAVESPIWVGLLATHARHSGARVEVLDAGALGLSPRQTASLAQELAPLLSAVVAYGHNPNASTHVMPAATEICEELKKLDPQGHVLLVGGHVAALPERSLQEAAADFTCDGEGPVTIAELISALRAGGGAELAKVRGLCWFDRDELRHNSPAPIVTRLDDEMPGMAWDLLPMERYRAHNWHCFGGRDRQPYAALYTTLGCPFRCTFCCIQAPFKSGEAAAGFKPTANSYRRWSPAHTIGQIDMLATRYGVANIKLADELFVLHRGHVEAICDGLIALGHDLNIWAYARVDTCADERLLEKLRAAGFRWLAIGIESASARVRDDVAKGYAPDTVESTIRRVQAHGIHVIANYIFGLPEDDHDSMRQTLDTAIELNTEFANFFSAMAYPGSQLYRDAQANGWQLPASWGGYSQHSHDCLPLPTRHLQSAQVLQFRDAAFLEYFDRPAFREMLGRAFGPTALDELGRMIAQPLPRALIPRKPIATPEQAVTPIAPS